MKRTTLILLAVVLTALPQLSFADDDNTKTEATAYIGGWGTNTEGVPDKVAEYEPVGGSPALGLSVKSHEDWGTYFIKGNFRASEDNSLHFDFDISRTVRSHTSYTKFLHRLGHDPMTNLEGTSFNGKAVWHENFDPFRDYELSYSLLDHRTEFQLPSLPALTLAVDYRYQKRDGHRQAFSNNHCDNCHVKSTTHALSETTKDATLEAKVAWRNGFVRGRFTGRTHTQGTSYLEQVYDDALHPELQKPVFDNRLQYDSFEGMMPYDHWADQDKDKIRLDLHFADVGGFAVNGTAVFTENENKFTGLKSDYSGYVVNAGKRFRNGVRLRWMGRVYSIENDDVYIDVNDRVTTAGPHAGKTYEDVYGKNYDHTRYSSLNRDAFESNFDLSYRVSKKAGTFKLEWDYDTVDRKHYEVLPGETETTTNLIGLSWRARPAKGWKLDARLRHATIDNPFMLVNGACSTLESDRYTNPWSPETPQYDDQHQTRIAETTASPSSWDEFRAGVTYMSGKTTVSGIYRWWDGDNKDGDLTDWSRSMQTITVTLWSAPSETWDWYVGGAWMESERKSHVCIPIFDG